MANAEQMRLDEALASNIPWKKWGPYVSERQWGTVREDYSESGNAWAYFSHDHSRSRAYRWGEDGIAGICDDKQRLCFALALWNGKDPILKERLFGLTNSESNHGEDVRECYFYLDSTPTHSWMRYLYKYPQQEFPYGDLVSTSAKRSRQEPEYELLDTGVFANDRYFDVFVEYAKGTPEDFLIRITVHNRGEESAELQVLPTLWFRNQWSWQPGIVRPGMRNLSEYGLPSRVEVSDPVLGHYLFECDQHVPMLFTENETNTDRIFGIPNRTRFVKDSIHRYVINGEQEAVNAEGVGTKVAAQYQMTLGPKESRSIRLRLSQVKRRDNGEPLQSIGRFNLASFDQLMQKRQQEADEFYTEVIPASLNADEKNVMRQALAGMLWGKQFYHFDVDKWLEERGSDTFLEHRRYVPRNEHWHHMFNGDVISMPDKWEYPWYASWDLAFHVLALTLVDTDFGKQQLKLMLRERYMHPNGQIPAYEWNFGDVNPPVHAWSTIFTYRLEAAQKGQGDREWLKNCFQKLLLNFTWWVNRKDRNGRNVFEGGFLGLDNIGVFDRSAALPTGGYLEQADGTAWMALFCQNMLEIATELAMTDPDYADMALKFSEHFLWIASAIGRMGGTTGMWDEEDGFYYDVLQFPDGRSQRLKVRSIVGLLPMCAATTFDGQMLRMYPELVERLQRFVEARPEIIATIHNPLQFSRNGRRLASVLNENRLRRVLETMLDEKEFLSDFGIRSLSRFHADNPYVFATGGREYRVQYLPGESDSGMFGGNSNWRGPVWMPVNALIIRSLLQYFSYYGNDFLVECPTGSGKLMNLFEVAAEITRRLSSIFLKDKDGNRPVFGGSEKYREDPDWKDYLQFFEYFHGDSGAGLGANHQTGWTGVIARLMHMFKTINPEKILAVGQKSVFESLAGIETDGHADELNALVTTATAEGK